MSWMLLHYGDRGLIASEDPQFRWTVMRGRTIKPPAQLELLFEPAQPPARRSSQPAVPLWPYAGVAHRRRPLPSVAGHLVGAAHYA